MSGTNMKRELHGCLKLCLHCKTVFRCSFALIALLMLQYKQREGLVVFSWCNLYRLTSNCGREINTANYTGMIQHLKVSCNYLLSYFAEKICFKKSKCSLKKRNIKKTWEGLKSRNKVYLSMRRA